jgi:coenzyme F420 biosynthesis associated uncharacterized protein
VDGVDWVTARRVAGWVSRSEPFAASYHYDALQPDFERFTAQAEALVTEATGLVSSAGPARARVVDRAGWVDANIASFNRLLRPLLRKLSEKKPGKTVSSISGHVSGAQLGAVLGWMSTRVLGQYDLLLIEGENEEDQDVVYYVGPNVLALEKRFGFPPDEFRLWLALHEVTHRMQFTGVDWLRPHFLSLVDGLMDSFDPDPKRFVAALRRVADDIRAGRDPLADGGIAAAIAPPAQREVLRKVGGLMSLLEGHGDVTMNRAGKGLVPSAPRFERVLSDRRTGASGPAKLMQRAIGIDAKLKQYEDGEKFIEAVERSGGDALMSLVWQGPEFLPSLDEIQSPPLWIERATVLSEQ